MIEELKEESLIRKVGGRFKLSTLIQKRLVSLNKGSRPFVGDISEVRYSGDRRAHVDKRDQLQIVIREIMEDRIYLDMDNNLVERAPEGPVVSALDVNPDLLDS